MSLAVLRGIRSLYLFGVNFFYEFGEERIAQYEGFTSQSGYACGGVPLRAPQPGACPFDGAFGLCPANPRGDPGTF